MLTPMFRLSDVFKTIDDYVDEHQKKLFLILSRVGEEFVNRARTNGSYRDITGNLRSSIGYFIAFNGKIIKANVEGKQAGKDAARKTAMEIISENPIGYVLVGVAGMEYAASVESRGREVITASSQDIKEEMQGALRDAGL